MARQSINLGTPPAGTDGDTIRTAFDKTESNFVELYDKNAQHDQAIASANNAAAAAQATAAAAVPKAGAVSVTGVVTFTANPSVLLQGQYPEARFEESGVAYSRILAYQGRLFIEAPAGSKACIRPYAGGASLTGLSIEIGGAERDVWHAGNTVVDANNFIKRA